MKCMVFCILNIITVINGYDYNATLRNPECGQPIDKGGCRAINERWAYDPQTNKCVEFIYGGCRGNENNFRSRRECNSKCLWKGVPIASNSATAAIERSTPRATLRTLRSPECGQPIDKGGCRAIHERWAYDPQSNKCVEFIYGGCRGNENNFRTRRECNLKCLWKGLQIATNSATVPTESSTPMTVPGTLRNPECGQPIDQGGCRAIIEKWAYIPKENKCVSFNYGGCRGNDNNFNSRRECNMRCVRKGI